MADSRRASTNPPLSAHPIPPAPPLPPPRNPVTARNAIARFVTQSLSTYGAARPQTAHTSRADGSRSRAAPLLPVIQGINALSSQDASHRTGLEISALDINQERTHAVLAGREILKTVHVSGTRCSEESNLRSAIINYASHNTRGSARHRETLDIHDVKWSHGAYSTHIATAATNGKVVLYDLARAGIELARLHEHYRQVHKLAFNPHQGYLLLSGSQDASVRLWDLRKLHKDRDAIVCRSQQAYQGQSEGIRDLRWSPTDGFEFAFGTDNGVIQRWDIRYAKGPKLKISAHDKICHAIDWHPDGKHLLSASSDKTVKVWDFSSEHRRQKPAWVLRTPYPVSNVRWRPPCLSSNRQDQGAWQCTQIATSFEKHDPVYIWDFRRPWLPFREIIRWNSPPTDMLWHSQHLLWTVGREGIFAQSDIQFAPKVLDRRSTSALALSPTGEVSVFSQKRPNRRESKLEYASDYSTSLESRDRHSVAENTSVTALSRSSADDSIDDNFLSSSYRRHHGRTFSNRSAKSMGSTPPSSEDIPIRSLEDTLNNQKDLFRPDQVAFRGDLGTPIDVQHFAYLAQKYKSFALKDPLSVESYTDLTKAFEKNADYAQRIAAYRIAQSFRIMGAAILYTVQQRAELIRQRRLGIEPAKSTGRVFQGSSKPAPVRRVEDTSRLTPMAIPFRPGESQHKTVTLESSSNVPTPLARPQSNAATDQHAVPSLSDLENEDLVSLPPPVAGPPPDSPTESRSPTDTRRSQLQRPEFNGPHWYSSAGDLSERRAMLSNWRQAPKAPLNLEPPGIMSPQSGPINIPPPLDRHNSDESFAMFSASTDSRGGLSIPGSFASGRSFSKQMEPVPEGWENSTSAESSGVWRSDSDPSQGTQEPSSDKIEQGSWPENGSLHLSSGSLEDPLAVPPPIPAKKEEKVKFEEPKERQGSTPLSPKHDAALPTSPRPLAAPQPVALSRTFETSTSGTGSQPSQNTWSTSNTSTSQAENLEASGTIVPDDATQRLQSPMAVQPEKPHVAGGVPVVSRQGNGQKVDSITQSLILSDYTSQDTVDTEGSSPFSAVDLLQSVLAYHSETLSDAQAASQLLLLLAPLLPPTHHPKPSQLSRTLATYTDYLNTIGFPPDRVQEIVSTSLHTLLLTGVHPYQAESILSTYHDQLMSLNLLNAAVNLRRQCYPAFPALYEQSIKDTSIGLRCEYCGNPINNPKTKLRCESCSRRQAPCPICWCERPAIEYPAPKSKKQKRKKSRTRTSSFAAQSVISTTSNTFAMANSYVSDVADPEKPNAAAASAALRDPAADPADVATGDANADPAPLARSTVTSPPPTLWLTCPLCNHSAHLSCFSAWLSAFSDPADLAEGACPSPGCTCDCAPGALRDERVRKIDERVIQRDRERGKDSRTVRDDWRAVESRAVSQVRGMVDPGSTAAAAAGGATVGAAAREGNKGDRRVRLVEPDESAAAALKRNWVMGN